MSTAYVCSYKQSMALIRLLGGLGSQQTSKSKAALLFVLLIAESAAHWEVGVLWLVMLFTPERRGFAGIGVWLLKASTNTCCCFFSLLPGKIDPRWKGSSFSLLLPSNHLILGVDGLSFNVVVSQQIFVVLPYINWICITCNAQFNGSIRMKCL